MKRLMSIVIVASLILTSCSRNLLPQTSLSDELVSRTAIQRDSFQVSRKALIEQRKEEFARNGFVAAQSIPATLIGDTCRANIYLKRTDVLHWTTIVYMDITGEDTVCHPPQWFIDHQYPSGYQRYLRVATTCINLGPEDLVIDTNSLIDYVVSPICEDGMYMKNYYKFYTEDCHDSIESYGYKEKLWLVSGNGLWDILHLSGSDTIVTDQEELDSLLSHGPYPNPTYVFNPAGNGGTTFPPFYNEPYRMVIDRGSGDTYWNMIPFTETSGYHNLWLRLKLPGTVKDSLYPNSFETTFRVDGDQLTFYQQMPNCCDHSVAPPRPTNVDLMQPPSAHIITWDPIPEAEGYKVYRGVAYQANGWTFEDDGTHPLELMTPTPITTPAYHYPPSGVFCYYFISAVNCAGESLRTKCPKKVK